MTTINDACAAARLLRRRLSGLDPVSQVVVFQHLDTIERFLTELGRSEAASAPVEPPPEPPRPLAHLEHDVAFAALRVREKRIEMAAFRAGVRATGEAMSVPYASFDAAVERLAKAMGK